MPTLKTNRCFLRKVEPSDIQHIFEGLSDPNVTKYYAVHFDTLHATQEQMDWYANLETTDTGIWFVIGMQETKELIGAIGYNDKKDGTAEIGYWLKPAYWNMGFISEVLPVAVSYGLDQLGLKKINAYVETGNEGSSKVLRSNHFKLLRIIKEEKGNKMIDVEVYMRSL